MNVVDSDQRQKAGRDTRNSYLVEASAGTGKTRVLVDRILNLVLRQGPQGPPLRIDQICAITFTEKAAGEMRIRIRRALEDAAAGGGDVAQRARDALCDLEAAAISTFHAFATALLKERPIEAGLDPKFGTLDEHESRRLFRDTWDLWIRKALSRRDPDVAGALLGGASVRGIRDLAFALRLNAGAVDELRLDPPPDDDSAARSARELRDTGLRHSRDVLDPGDKLALELQAALEWLAAPAGGLGVNPGGLGRARNWRGGAGTVSAVRAYLLDVGRFALEYSLLGAQRRLDALTRKLSRGFLPYWRERKRSAGLVDFDDQLRLARDLLSRSAAARQAFQRRFEALLIDEFQDTDPIQLEIALLLSSTDLASADLLALRPAPGRLFVVGDPKQSIYRFRGADIESYLEVAAGLPQSAAGTGALQLSANFRSVPSILRFVDRAFSEVMQRRGPGYQCDYLAFGEGGVRPARSGSTSVGILGDWSADGRLMPSGPDFVRLESRRVAQLAACMPGSAAWEVADRDDPSLWRPPGFGDIAVLLPVLTRTYVLEEELKRFGVPYVLEGGKFYYARPEVASAVALLQAIGDPNNPVALYAGLRSAFFGLSDQDLLEERLSGVPLDYRADLPRQSKLHTAFALIRHLHAARHRCPVSETLERLLAATGAREVLAASGFQALANLNKLARMLRSLQGRMTYNEVLDQLRSIDEEEAAETESRIMEERSDAVRVMSVHKAKGLDFPIVILAGFGIETGARGSSFIADFHRAGAYAVSLQMQPGRVCSPGWKDLAESERDREDAELVRLLYVAATRARDHLVLSTHHRGKEAGGILRASLGKTRLSPLEDFLCRSEAELGKFARFIGPEEYAHARECRQESAPVDPEHWAGQLAREHRELDALLSLPASRFAPRAPWSSGPAVSSLEREQSRAARVGSAFHEAMEHLRTADPSEVGAAISGVSARFRLAPQEVEQVSEMALRTLGSPLMERVFSAARAGGRVLRELPYVTALPVGDADSEAADEGKIDLVFEEGDSWVLVDFKTDSMPETSAEDVSRAIRDRYCGQMRRYESALRRLGLPVSRSYVLLARTGAAVQV